MRNLIEQAEFPEMVVYVVRTARVTFKSNYFHSVSCLNQCRATKENTACLPSVRGPHSEEYIEDAMVSVVIMLTVTELVMKCLQRHYVIERPQVAFTFSCPSSVDGHDLQQRP